MTGEKTVRTSERLNKTTPTVELNSDEFKIIQSQIATLSQQLSIAQAIVNKEKNRTEELSNMQTRLQADFDNYRKRTAESSKKLKEEGYCECIEKVLPLTDVMDQAIAMIKDEQTAEGLKMMLKQFMDTLSGLGVAEIPALGQQFDPNLHNAVMNVEVEDKSKANTIVEVFQKGYRIGDRILRYSVVKVGK